MNRCPIASDTARHLDEVGRASEAAERADEELAPIDAMPDGYAEHRLPPLAEKALFAAMRTGKAGAPLIAELSIAFAAACHRHAEKSGQPYRAVRAEYALPYPHPDEIVTDGRWSFDAPLDGLFGRALCGNVTTVEGAPLAPALARELYALRERAVAVRADRILRGDA